MIGLHPLLRTALFAALGSFAASALAQQALTLQEAQQITLGRSLELTALESSAEAARHRSIAARQLPDPVLRLGLDNVPVNGPQRFTLTRDFMTMARVGLMQEFTRDDKRQARSARFERELDALRAARLLTQTKLRRNVSQAWLDLHFQQSVLGILATQRVEAGLQIEAADSAYRSARGSQAEVFAARSALAQIDDRIELANAQSRSAQAMLSRWVGAEAQRPLAEPPDLSKPRLDTARLESELLRHPQIALLLGEEAVAMADVDVARSEKRSDWTVELMYSQRGSAYSNMLSVGASIPWQWDQKNRQDRELSARLAQVERLQAQREDLARELLAQGQSWLLQWQGHRQRLALFDRSILPLAIERTRAALAAYRGGASPLAAVLEARRGEIDARLDRLRIETESAALWVQLSFLSIDEQDLAAAALHTQNKEATK